MKQQTARNARVVCVRGACRKALRLRIQYPKNGIVHFFDTDCMCRKTLIAQKVFFDHSRARAKATSTLLRRTRQSCLAAALSLARCGETPTSSIARHDHSSPHSPLGSHRRSHLPTKSHTMATQAAVMSAKATQVRTAPRARKPVTRFPASFYLAWLFHGTPSKKPSGLDPRARGARGNPRTPRPTDRDTSWMLRARPAVAFPRSSVAHPPRRGSRHELWIMPRRVPSGRRAPLRFFEHFLS